MFYEFFSSASEALFADAVDVLRKEDPNGSHSSYFVKKQVCQFLGFVSGSILSIFVVYEWRQKEAELL